MQISVSLDAHNNDTYLFAVRVGEHSYRVSFSEAYYQKLTSGKILPHELTERSFKFLLSKESPAQILKEFDLPLINKYFEDYETVIQESVL